MENQKLINASVMIAKVNVNENVAAVTVVWDETPAKLTVTYHTVGVVSEDDQELCELTLTELLAEFPDIRVADSQCVSTCCDASMLEQLEGVVYVR